MVFIYHRLKKPSVFDFEIIPSSLRNFIYYLKRRFFPNIDVHNLKEATQPLVKTSSIPGAKGKGALNSLAIFSLDYKNKRIFANPDYSFKNYIVDVDDNTILDLNVQGTPLGYNNPHLINLSQTSVNERLVINNNVNNKGTITGDSLAYLATLKKYLHFGDLSAFIPTNNINDTLYNLVALNPKFFNNNPRKNVVANLADNIFSERNNGESEEDFFARLGEEVTRSIVNNKDFLLGIIVEPFAETKNGHLYLNSAFANQVRKTCFENNIAFIVDETNSCLNSGSIFGLNYWNLNQEPDYVVLREESNINPGILTSLKNAEIVNFIEGFRFYTRQLSNSVEVMRIVKEENLLQNITKSGEYLRNKLKQSEINNKISNIRGVGNYTSFDLENKEKRDAFNQGVLNNGVSLFSNGNKTITARSSLIVKNSHYDILVKAMEHAKF